ncbi:MAG: hypothetical protein SFV18_04185 [Bryobacteraceae bacterium]|nr:hypothetical protein [Bryobacteraceae bacterium]
MPASVTSTLRISAALRKKVDRRAKQLKTNRNALITSMIEESLKRAEKEELRERVRADAIRIAESDKTNPDVLYWEKVAEDARAEWWHEVK